jgi:hypothetical protein
VVSATLLAHRFHPPADFSHRPIQRMFQMLSDLVPKGQLQFLQPKQRRRIFKRSGQYKERGVLSRDIADIPQFLSERFVDQFD